jgi:hypothetical protein
MIKDKYNRWVNHFELYPLLGIPAGGHLPKEGFIKEVQGVHIECRPAPEPKGYKSSKHRLFYVCKTCDQYVPTGRWQQHIKGRKHREGV